MVTNATSLSHSGLSDWIIQRSSAYILAAYTLFVLGVFIVNPEMGYEQWNALFESNPMRLFSLITIFALCGHAWIGLWTITTDYLNVHHFGAFATTSRLIVQAICALITVTYLFWGIQIFWGS
ncbi:MAG: succinate dehydrogenase / fumarate reductase membrane anchor subunit [Pseudohongiellaceae bacterium]|jgi:succinate dehydrogenase / fumarate reductase membrane anchor subunit